MQPALCQPFSVRHRLPGSPEGQGAEIMTSCHRWTQTVRSSTPRRGGPTSGHQPCATGGQSPPGQDRCRTPRCSVPRPPATTDQHQQVSAGVGHALLPPKEECKPLSMAHCCLTADEPF